jgi:GntR family histidine utilization transcriptional repressor
MDLDFAAVTPNQYLMEAAPLSEVEHVVEAVLPEADVRELLEIRAGEPCLRLHRRTWSRGRVASSATLTYPGTAHRFSTRFTYRDKRGRGPAPIQQRHTNGGGTP